MPENVRGFVISATGSHNFNFRGSGWFEGSRGWAAQFLAHAQAAARAAAASARSGLPPPAAAAYIAYEAIQGDPNVERILREAFGNPDVGGALSRAAGGVQAAMGWPRLSVTVTGDFSLNYTIVSTNDIRGFQARLAQARMTDDSQYALGTNVAYAVWMVVYTFVAEHLRGGCINVMRPCNQHQLSINVDV